MLPKPIEQLAGALASIRITCSDSPLLFSCLPDKQYGLKLPEKAETHRWLNDCWQVIIITVFKPGLNWRLYVNAPVQKSILRNTPFPFPHFQYFFQNGKNNGY